MTTAMQATKTPATGPISTARLRELDLAHHLPDELHPDAEGYRIMGANFLHEVSACGLW